MERLNVELILALQLDEAHGRTRRRLGDALRVAIVVLLRLDVGSNILRGHQAHVVTVNGEDTTEMMGATASLHRDNARRKLRREADERLALHVTSQHDRASRNRC